MRSILIAAMAMVFCPVLALAEEVVLKDGKVLFGEIKKQGDDIVLVDFMGRTLVLTDQIAEIKDSKILVAEYEEMLKLQGDKPNHFNLGIWCWKRGLRDESAGHFGAVVESDPDNPAARWALGHVKVRGIWVTPGVWTKLPGPDKTWVRYIPEGAKGKLNVRQGEAPPHDAREMLRKMCRGSADEKKSAAEALAGMPEDEKREGFLLSMEDNASVVRSAAAGKLVSFKGLDVAKSLVRAAVADTDAKVRSASVKSLAEGQFPEAKDLLMCGLTSKNLNVKINAIDALAFFPARDTAEALATVMGSATARIPHANIFVGRQVSYVKDFDVEVAAFAGIGDPIMGTAIEGAVLDVKILAMEVSTVRIQRRAAWSTLCSMAGKDLGQEVSVWRNWAAERFGKG